MSLATATGAATFDRTANTFVIDLEKELAELIRPDNQAFLDRVGTNGLTAVQRTKYWVEDELNPYSAQADGSLASDATSLSVQSGQGTRFKVGTTFKDKATGKTEVMQVTAISGDTLTITRGIGSTSAEAHDTDFEIQIIAHTKAEGWKPNQEDWTKERSSVYNYTQIFGMGITLSKSRQQVEQTVIASELAHQTAYRLKELTRQLDGSLINSVRSSNPPSDTEYGSMGGLLEFASQSGGNTNTTTEDLTERVVNAMMKQIWDDAGGLENGFMLMNGGLKQVVATFDQAYRRSDFDQKHAGFTVEKFLTDLGFWLEVIVDPWMPSDVLVIGDLNKIKLGPLQGDAMALEQLAKTGRTLEYMISGQYTAMFKNATSLLAYHNNLS